MPGVLTIGEALIDVLEGGSGTPVEHVGGSPLNVAVGLARLGAPSTLHTSLADDPRGRFIRKHLADSGVRLTPASVNAPRTSTARARLDASGAASYEFDIAGGPSPADCAGYALVHTGSLGALLPASAAAVRRMIDGATGLVSFDPNIRPLLMDDRERVRGDVEEIVARADIVKASDEDVAWLYPDAAIRDVMDSWHVAGARLVVVTRGADGVDALVDGAWSHRDAESTVVVDTIGAGDSFMAGLLFGILQNGLDGADAALRLADRCATITVSRAGANPPWRRELPL